LELLDRVYLVRLVSARTGLTEADADRRVTQVVENTRGAARRARASSVIIGFNGGIAGCRCGRRLVRRLRWWTASRPGDLATAAMELAARRRIDPWPGRLRPSNVERLSCRTAANLKIC
jgi:hypothetical protein